LKNVEDGGHENWRESPKITLKLVTNPHETTYGITRAEAKAYFSSWN
jgi:hypothetical protein